MRGIRIIYIFLIMIFLRTSLYATEDVISKIRHIFDFSGYINYKAFYNTRQIVGAADDQTLYFPKQKMPTPTGDINAKGEGQMLPIETRLRVTIHEARPEKKHSERDSEQEEIEEDTEVEGYVRKEGVVEIEFNGPELQTGELDLVNLVNMRHAYLQLDGKHSTFIFGQTWHPLNVEELAPNNVAFNDGRPFAVYNRSPMLNYTYHAPHVDIILAATSQVDFVSDGPQGENSEYMRNAVIPNLHFQLKGFFGEHVIAGTGIDYQRIAPRLESDQGYKVRENLSSLAGIWYLKLMWPKIAVSNTLMFGGNLSNYGIIGGYAVEKGSINPVTGYQKYTTTRTITGWSDWTITPTETFEMGWFIGGEKNCGSRKQIEHDVINPDGTTTRRIFGLGNNLDTVFRFSPRFRFKVRQVTFALEVEYTRAAFGNDAITPDGLNDHGRAVDPIPVANTQVLFSTFLFF